MPEGGCVSGGAEPGGGEDRIGAVVVDASGEAARRAAEDGERGVEIGGGAHLAAAGRAAGGAGGEAGVDFDNKAALPGIVFERPPAPRRPG